LGGEDLGAELGNRVGVDFDVAALTVGVLQAVTSVIRPLVMVTWTWTMPYWVISWAPFTVVEVALAGVEDCVVAAGDVVAAWLPPAADVVAPAVEL
jgi:hypothetical protein